MIVLFDRKKIMKDANAWGDLMRIKHMEKDAVQMTPHATSEMAPKRVSQTHLQEEKVIGDAESQKIQNIKAELRSLGFSTDLVRVS